MKQLVCTCGWKSSLHPDYTMFAGPGGQLSCPICTMLQRNRNIEVYGEVRVAKYPPYSGWVYVPGMQRCHYLSNGKSLCKRHDLDPADLDYMDPRMMKDYLPRPLCFICVRRKERM